MSASGSFATARKGADVDLGFLLSTLEKTKSYASTARITGVNEVTLRNLLPPPSPRPEPVSTVLKSTPSVLTPKELIMLLCAEENVPYAAIIGTSQVREVAWPRMRMYWVMRKTKPRMSLPEIGRRFGGRDHTTIIYGIRRFEEAYHQDPEERRHLDKLLDAVAEADGTNQTIEYLDRAILTAQEHLDNLLAKRAEYDR